MENIFNFDKKTGTILGFKKGVEIPEDLVIPEGIDGVTVTEIGDCAFYVCDKLKKIGEENENI